MELIPCHLQKLTKQLALPPEYRIKKAKVSRLQITVPLDLYSSSIELTAVGVHICLEISSADAKPKSTPERDDKKATGADLVPTAADLAQSFLDTQPTKEKRALEEALAAEQQDLGASITSSEDGSEEDLSLGTGQGLSLPVFLTDFLQGVVDRTRVTVRDVAFHLDIEVPIEPKSPETELVSLRVSLDELHVEGVTTQIRDDGSSKIVPKEGKRHILLSDIRASLISQADIFSSLTRSPSMTSAASRSPVVTQRRAPSPSEPFPATNLEGQPSTEASEDLAHSPRLLEDSEEALQIPYELDDWSGAEGSEQRRPEPDSTVSTPRASIYHEFSGHADSSVHSSILEDESLPWPSTLGPPAVIQEALPLDEQLQHSVSSDTASDDSGAHFSEDLSQSHYFSHEEAQSMYMSAFSQTDSQRLSGESMPGAWNSNPASPEASSKAPPKDRPVTTHNPSPPGSELMTGESSDEALAKEAAPSTPISAAAQDQTSVEPGGDLPTEVTPKTSTDNLAQNAALGGPARLVKELISLESISVYLPTKHKHIHVSSVDETATLAESAFHNVPGAFSVHSSIPQTSEQFQNAPQLTEKDGDDFIEIHFAPLECRFDASVGFLLAMVAQRLLEASKHSQRNSDKTEDIPSKKFGASVPSVKLSVQKISLLFIEKIFGVADTSSRPPAHVVNFGSEPLLKAEFESIQATIVPSVSSTETTINLDRFRIGYNDSDILSFDREAQMWTSVRDTFPEAGADVSVKLSTSEKTSRCEVTTLPLRVHLDLQRLDETFTWFGGLSGFLQMSASMTSSSSPEKPVVKHAKARGVRFDVPARPKREETTSETEPGYENKTDVRIGGMELDLVGKTCGMRFRASAVKMSNRWRKLGVTVGRIQVSGPHHNGVPDAPPIDILVGGTRLEYLFAPRDVDLDRLLALITPSKGQFDEVGDDEIMVDTLLRQRRKGSVLNLTIDDVQVKVSKLHRLDSIPALGEELARLGAVAKYLPEDDRPGLLTLGLVENMVASVDIGGRFGVVNAQMTDFELAHVTFPSLAAIGVNSIKVDRNRIEELVGSSNDSITGLPMQSPVLMVRMIGDQMEPAIKVRMRNINFEYRVPTIMDALGLSSETTPQEFDAMLAQSVANLGERAHHALVGTEPSLRQTPAAPKAETAKPTVVNMAFRNCLLGLNPLGLTSKLTIVLIDAHVEVGIPAGNNVNAEAALKKAALLLIDDVSLLETTIQGPGPSSHRGSDAKRPTDVLSTLCSKGYANICQISSARVTVKTTAAEDGETHIDAELRDNFLVLETCADSFHTLTLLAGALKPPTPPSKEVKYKTQVIPMQDMLSSITADAFGKAEGDYNFDDDFALAQEFGGGDDLSDGELVEASPPGVRTKSSAEELVAENIFDATSSSILSNRTTAPSIDAARPDPTAPGVDFGLHSEIEVHENFFAVDSSVAGTAHRWDSARNKYDELHEAKVRKSPLKVRVRDVHVIWNLFDGYDWQQTRDAITKTVEEVENQAFERRRRSGRRSLEEPDFDDEDVIGDCLFNSIYVSIPANHDPRELVGGINLQLDETESIATTTATQATTGPGTGRFRSRAKKLRLGRSRRHKITFELSGVNVDLVKFPPGSGETDTSIDVRVNNLDVFDHVPTSTWKKFITYNQDAGERELGTSMVHLELLLVKPIADLAASEFVLKATVLPLRLHVDQDALDFIERFFQFKDESQTPAYSSPSDEAFIQRAEINSIPIVLDFKPKRVDYAGLRGGRTSEFMNFIILESARMTLRHTIVYGITGWERLGNTLNDIWTPDVKRTQLAGVLAGVGPVRHIVNVGSGFRDLIEIPIKEYKKDGRIVRSIGKGAAAFARTTGTEIVKLGAKMAVGTQYVLQGAEGMLSNNPGEGSATAGEAVSIQAGWDEEGMEPEEKKQISLYADQPTGVIQGLRHAYSSLARDLNVARDAIIAVPAEVMESRNAQGAATAVMRRAPTIIFRPAIGATRAVGQALMGATNALDPENLRRVDDVSVTIAQVSGIAAADDLHRNTNPGSEGEGMGEMCR